MDIFILGHFVVGHMMAHGQNTGDEMPVDRTPVKIARVDKMLSIILGQKYIVAEKKSVKAHSRICVSIKPCN